MHERFDRIDRTLNIVMETLTTRFANIDRNIDEVQEQILAVDAALQALSQNMYQVVSDGFQQELWLKANRALNHKLSGTPLQYTVFANDYAVDFATWATILSRNSVYNPPAVGGYDNASAYDQLVASQQDDPYTPGSALSLDRNINYLFRLLRNRWPNLSPTNGDLPNPNIWAVAARAYTELTLDWRDHARQLDATRESTNAQLFSTQIINAGTELQNALRQISTHTTTEGPRANYPLFEALFTNYQTEVANLEREIVKLEEGYLEELRTAPEPDRGEVIKLWDNADQPITHPSLPVMEQCNGNALGLSTPSVLSSSINNPYRLADYLLIGKARVCAAGVNWVDIRETTVRHGCPFNCKYYRTAYGKLAVTIQSRYDEHVIMERSLTLEEQVIGTCEAHSHCFILYNDPIGELRTHWEQGRNLKSQFEGSSTANPPSDASQRLADVTAQVEQRLQEEQQRLYSKIIDGFKVGPVHDAAKRLSGAKALLEAFITLGLPRALERDDALRMALRGSERVLDEDAEHRLTMLYTAAFVTPPSHNVRSDIFTLVNDRLDSLHDTTWKYLDRIDEQWYTESHRLVETTLNRIKVAQALVHTSLPVVTPTPTPPNPSSDATIYIEPSQLVLRPNASGTLTVMVDPGSSPVNGVHVRGKVNPQFVQIIDVTATTHLPVTLEPVRFDAATAEFSYSGGLLDSVMSAPFVILTLTIKSIAPTSAQGIDVDFLSDYPPTNISGPNGTVLREAKSGKIIVTNEASTLRGMIALQGRENKPHASWSIPLSVELIPTSSTTPLLAFNVQTDQSGTFDLPSSIGPGHYNVRLKGEHTISTLVRDINIQQATGDLYLGPLLEGDIETATTSNEVILTDFGVLSGSMNRCKGEPGYIQSANLNESTDQCVTMADFGLFAGNYNMRGDVIYDASNVPPLPQLNATALLYFDAPQSTSKVSETTTVAMYIEPNESPVNGVMVHLGYDPSVVEIDGISLITDTLALITEEVSVDHEQGRIRFALGSVDAPVSRRFQVADFQVRLKAAVQNTELLPLDSFPPTDVTGPQGSVLAQASGLNLSARDPANEPKLPLLFESYLPLVSR